MLATISSSFSFLFIFLFRQRPVVRRRKIKRKRKEKDLQFMPLWLRPQAAVGNVRVRHVGGRKRSPGLPPRHAWEHSVSRVRCWHQRAFGSGHGRAASGFAASFAGFPLGGVKSAKVFASSRMPLIITRTSPPG